MPADDVVQFGGWRGPPRWVRVAAGVAAVAALAGLILSRAGPHRAAGSTPSRPPATARSPGPGSRAPASVAQWPSDEGPCGSTVDLPLIHLARQHTDIRGRTLVGGTALREITPGGHVSGPLPGLPAEGAQVTDLVAGPGAAYAVDIPCVSSTGSVRVYRIAAGGARPLGIAADVLLAGPHHAWAVTYLPGAVRIRALEPRPVGGAVTVKTSIAPVADTAAGLVVTAYHPPGGRRHTVELIDPETGAVLRRLGAGSAMGASGHVLLVSLHGCDLVLTHRTCTLESINLNTGRPAAAVELPAGRVPISGEMASAVLSPDGTLAAFQLARARQDPRFAAPAPVPPSDVAILQLHTGRLDIVPGLELPPLTWTGLAFDPTGTFLLITVSEGNRGELLAWRQGMPGPALVTILPGPLLEAPPLLPVPSWWRTG